MHAFDMIILLRQNDESRAVAAVPIITAVWAQMQGGFGWLLSKWQRQAEVPVFKGETAKWLPRFLLPFGPLDDVWRGPQFQGELGRLFLELRFGGAAGVESATAAALIR